MKRSVLIAVFCLLTLNALSQKFELSVQANSGVSYFRGPGVQSATFLSEGSSLNNGYTFAVYGNQQQVSYGFSFNAKAVITHNVIVGLQAGYDVLRSRVNLYNDDRYSASESFSGYYSPPIGGYTTLTNQFINLNPYIGYRVNIKQVYIDFTPGLDIAFGLRGHEKGETKSNYGNISNYNSTATTDQNTDLPKQDYRLRFDIKAGFKKFGITAGYARGLTDYSKNEYTEYGSPRYSGAIYADVMRIGLSYRIY